MSRDAVSLNNQRQKAFRDEVKSNEKASASAVAREKQRQKALKDEASEGARIGKLNASPVGGYKTLAASPKGMAEAARQFRSQVTENEKASASAVALNKQREKALRDEVKANEAQSASAVSLNKQREKAQRDTVKLNEQMSASAVSLNKQRQQAFKVR